MGKFKFIWFLAILVNGCVTMKPVWEPVTQTSVNENLTYDLRGKTAIVSNDLNSILPDLLTPAFLSAGFNVVERNYLIKILEEQKLSLTGLLENSDYYKIGKIANIKYLIIANESKRFREGYIRDAFVKIIDIESGNVISSTNYSNAFNPYNGIGCHSQQQSATAIVNSIRNNAISSGSYKGAGQNEQKNRH